MDELLGHVGYAWDLAAVILRPSLGAGYATLKREVSSSSAAGEMQTSSTEDGLALSPGVEARFAVGVLSVCAELRYDVVLRDGNDPMRSSRLWASVWTSASGRCPNGRPERRR